MPLEFTGLTSRFWVTDMAALAKLDKTANGVRYADADEKQFVGKDSRLSSLIGTDPLAEQHLNRARIFAATHPAPPNQRALDDTRIGENAARLNVVRDDFRQAVRMLALAMNKSLPMADRFDEASLDGHVATAVDRLFASKDVTELCARIDAPRNLTPVENLELKNAALGLVKMLQSGRIDAAALVYFVDHEAYDFRNAADLVRVADKTRRAVRENFIDRKGVTDIETAAGKRINLLAERGLITPQQKTELWLMLATLTEKGDALVDARTDASRILDEIPMSSKPNKSLKRLREAFRGFRYDLDRARGALMPGRGEAFRRFCDDLGNFRRPRVTDGDYRNLRRLDTDFNELVDRLDEKITGCLIRQGTFNDQPEEVLALGNAMRSGLLSVARRAQEVTDLTHETNDMIRAHFQSDDSFSKEMHKLLDTTVRHGGKRTVTIGGGLDVGINKSSVGVTAKVGVGGSYTVSIEVPPGGGRVRVTRLGQGGAEAKVNVNTAIGKVKAGGDLMGGGGKTVTYDTLDDAIRALKGHSLLTAGSTTGLILSGVGKALAWPFRMLGSGVAKILRWTGALAQKVRADNLAFRDHVKASGALDATDEILSLGKNTRVDEVTGFRHVTASAGGGVAAKKVKANFNGSYTYYREFGAKRTVFTPFVASLLDKSAADGRAVLLAEGAKLNGNHPHDGELLRLMTDVVHCSDVVGARALLARLTACLDALERGVRDAPDSSVSRPLAQRFRFCAAAYAMLDRILTNHADDSDAARTERDATRKLFTDRLANPAVEFSEEVFDGMLVTKRAGYAANRVRHTVKANVDLTPSFGDIFENPTTAPLNYFVQRSYGPSSKVSVTVNTDRPVEKTDPRPWKNRTSLNLGVKVGWNLPLQALVGLIADQVAAQTAQKPLEVKKEIISCFKEAGLPITIGGLGTLATWSFGQLFLKFEGFRNFVLKAGGGFLKFVGKAALKLPLAAMSELLSVMETEGRTNNGVALTFGFRDGHFQSFACANDLESSRRIGIRPGGVVGGHVDTEVNVSENRQCIFFSPTLDTAMEKCDDCGSAAQFHAFATDNATGMLKLFDKVALRDESCRRRESEAYERLANLPGDVADGLRARLDAARQAFEGIGADASAFRKIQALEDYVGALTTVFRQMS